MYQSFPTTTVMPNKMDSVSRSCNEETDPCLLRALCTKYYSNCYDFASISERHLHRSNMSNIISSNRGFSDISSQCTQKHQLSLPFQCKGGITYPNRNPYAPSTVRRRDKLTSFKRAMMFTLCFIAILNLELTEGKIRSRDPGDPVGNIRHVLPELELGNNSVTDVRFNVGSTAFLPCRFPSFPRHHENRVSWVRRWDWHILTAGLFTYTNDDRFVVLHKDGSNDWTLQIKFLHTQDNGTYECQVHSGSGFMSQFVNLHVITPRAVIMESKELTVKNGDNFGLTCIIQQSLEPPVYVMWLHGGVPVNYAPDRPRLTVQMEVKGSTSRSLLKVRDAKYTDSGNYTCTAPNAVNAWVLVYVTEGDTVAAVQRRHPDSSGTSSSSASSAESSASASSSSSTSGAASTSSVSSKSSNINCLEQLLRNNLLCVVFCGAFNVIVIKAFTGTIYNNNMTLNCFKASFPKAFNGENKYSLSFNVVDEYLYRRLYLVSDRKYSPSNNQSITIKR